MSEAGTFANMYEKYKELCQLVDQVLLDIHMNRSNKKNPMREKLANLLKEISSKTNLIICLSDSPNAILNPCNSKFHY